MNPPTRDATSQHETDNSSRSRASSDTVIQAKGSQRGLFAGRSFKEGEAILTLAGTLTKRPTRTSIQICTHLHLDACDGDPSKTGSSEPDPSFDPVHPWRFLNHSCAPTVRIAAPEVIAIADIELGDELTFDYNTSEVEMDEPFPCECKSQTCRQQMIRGFAHLSQAERTRIAPLLSPHLARLMTI